MRNSIYTCGEPDFIGPFSSECDLTFSIFRAFKPDNAPLSKRSLDLLTNGLLLELNTAREKCSFTFDHLNNFLVCNFSCEKDVSDKHLCTVISNIKKHKSDLLHRKVEISEFLTEQCVLYKQKETCDSVEDENSSKQEINELYQLVSQLSNLISSLSSESEDLYSKLSDRTLEYNEANKNNDLYLNQLSLLKTNVAKKDKELQHLR